MVMKKNHWLIGALSLFIVHVHAQEPAWQVGFHLSPGLGWQQYFTRSDSSAAMEEVEEANTIARNRFAYSFGATIGYRLNDRVTLTAGISLSRKGSQTKDIAYNPGVFTGEMAANTVQHYCYDQYFLSVPLEALYTIDLGRRTFYAGAGINTEVYMKTRIIQEITSQSDGDRDTFEYKDRVKPYRRLLLSGMVNFGYQHILTDRLHLRVGPAFQFPLMGMLQPRYAFVDHRLYAVQFDMVIGYLL